MKLPWASEKANPQLAGVMGLTAPWDISWLCIGSALEQPCERGMASHQLARGLKGGDDHCQATAVCYQSQSTDLHCASHKLAQRVTIGGPRAQSFMWA